MIAPDLAKELAFWVPRLALGDWQLSMRYEADPRDPQTGKPVDGLCMRWPHIPKAEILIRAPRTEAEVPNTYDSIVHELMHVRLGKLDGSVLAEENAVWPLAAQLTELRMSYPAKFRSLCKAIASVQSRPAAQSRAKAGVRYKMDEEKAAALAALALKIGEILAAGGVPEELKGLLEQLVALAAGGSAPVEAPVENVTPEEPAIGMKPEDEKPMPPATKIRI